VDWLVYERELQIESAMKTIAERAEQSFGKTIARRGSFVTGNRAGRERKSRGTKEEEQELAPLQDLLDSLVNPVVTVSRYSNT